MDPFFLTVFGFILLLTLLVGGFVLLYPLSRALAAWVNLQLEERQKGMDPVQIADLTNAIQKLEGEIERMAERQAFTEKLVAGPQIRPLPDSGSDES